MFPWESLLAITAAVSQLIYSIIHILVNRREALPHAALSFITVTFLALILQRAGFFPDLIVLLGGPGRVTEPSRMFAGPQQYPPDQFKAYGIVAFSARPTTNDTSHYSMICEAYVSALDHFTLINAPRSEQMVTVWPIENVQWADRINAERRDKVCRDAVPHYELDIALDAIRAARRRNAVLDGQGPFLLAWSPGSAKGQPDALVLISDMSDVINGEQAKQIFTQWALDIQKHPELWEKGWNEEKIKLVIRLWVDKWGKKILKSCRIKDIVTCSRLSKA